MTNENSAEGNNGSTCTSPHSDEHAEKKLTSRFRGVCWNRKNKRWQAAINHAGKYIYLGSFIAEEEAAKAFDRAAVKLRGSAAKINFPFSDYPAEMSWNKVVVQNGDATDAVLKNPRCLRNKIELPIDGLQALAGVLPTPPYLSHAHCNFNQAVYPYPQTAGRAEPLQGRVIGAQGQQPVHNGVVNPMYYFTCRGDTPVETAPMPSGVYMNGGGQMLATSQVAAFPAAPAHLSNPAVRPEQLSQPAAVGRTWPVVSMPQGAELTHWFPGPQNAFAMGFVRSEAAPTEVLLYDGRAMHDVGSFSTKDDAAQTCQSLLSILNKFNSGQLPQPQSPAKTSLPEVPPVHHQMEKPNAPGVESETAIPGELKGKSPFDIPPGSHPVFKNEDAENDRLQIPQKFDRPTIELSQTDLKGRTNSAPLDLKSGSLKQRMGSLLQLEPTLSVGKLDVLSPSTPSASLRMGGCRSESNVRMSTQSLRQSGSLQKMLSALNSSGILRSIKKESSEDETADTPFSAGDLPFSRTPEPQPTLSAQFVAHVESVNQPSVIVQHSEYLTLHMNNGAEHFTPFRKRKPVEMTLQNQGCKKMKEDSPLHKDLS